MSGNNRAAAASRNRVWAEDKLTVLRDLMAGGATLALCAQHFGCSREAIGGVCDREGIRTLNKNGSNRRVGGLSSVKVAASTAAPSAAMVRLAEFDPAVRRALRVRQGLDAEG